MEHALIMYSTRLNYKDAFHYGIICFLRTLSPAAELIYAIQYLYTKKNKLHITLLLYSEIFSRISYLRQYVEVLISCFGDFLKTIEALLHKNLLGRIYGVKILFQICK